MKYLFQTDSHNINALILRITLAIVFFPHGAQKALGWYGGHGFSGSLDYFTQSVGLPWIIAFLVIIAEFLGSLALAIGFLTRLAALGIGCVMTGAIFMVHFEKGFFMDWRNTQQGEGFEFHLLVLGIVLALLISGGGKWSVDSKLSK